MAAPFTFGEFILIVLESAAILGALTFGLGFLACAIVRGWWAERK